MHDLIAAFTLPLSTAFMVIGVLALQRARQETRRQLSLVRLAKGTKGRRMYRIGRK